MQTTIFFPFSLQNFEHILKCMVQILLFSGWCIICSLDYGQAVYKARNLLHLLSGSNQKFSNECESTPIPPAQARKRKAEQNQNHTENNYFSITPNPGNGSFLLTLPDGLNNLLRVSIFNMLGEVIFTETNFTGKVLPIKLNAPKGVFSLQIESTSGEVIYWQKIINH